MKTGVLLILALWLLSLSARQMQDRLSQVEGRVTAVHDGDTFTVETATQKWVCRLANVDAPELAQPFGVMSRDSVRALLLGRAVRVKLRGQDIYRCWLVEVWVAGDPTHAGWERVDSLLIVRGWAWHYTPYSRDKICAKAMVRAQSERRGLWALSQPMAPWLYRKARHIGL